MDRNGLKCFQKQALGCHMIINPFRLNESPKDKSNTVKYVTAEHANLWSDTDFKESSNRCAAQQHHHHHTVISRRAVIVFRDEHVYPTWTNAIQLQTPPPPSTTAARSHLFSLIFV